MTYWCANCGGQIRVAGSAPGDGLTVVRVGGVTAIAHRVCPDPVTLPVGDGDRL